MESEIREMRFKGFIFNLVIFIAAAFTPLQAVTTIQEDTKGAILNKPSAEANGIPEAQTFDSLYRDQVYVNIKTAEGLLIHIRADEVVKYVFFLKPDSFPTKFQPEDLEVVKAKLDELRAFAALRPMAANVSAPYLKSLQKLYDTESAKYKKSMTAAAQESNAEEEKAAFDKKCELMQLDLVASKDDIKRSEEIVKSMEPLAGRSTLLAGVLAKWNEEKSRALQFADEGKKIWSDALKAHPESFAPLKSVNDIPDFPADLKAKAADFFQRLTKFRTSVTYPQTLSYCRAELPAYFLLTQLADLVEKIKAGKYENAVTLSQKTFTQVEEKQIVDPYKPVYAAFKNDKDLAQDFQSRYLSQLVKLKQTESDYTDTELLGEYQKLYNMIPDPKVAARMEQIKAKIKAH